MDIRSLRKNEGVWNEAESFAPAILPKDRNQLARQLNIDWKAVHYQIALLKKFRLVEEHEAYDKVKLYQLTKLGHLLIELVEEVDSNAGRARLPLCMVSGPSTVIHFLT